MIFTMEEVGKLILKQNDVMEFKNEFNKLYPLAGIDNMFFHNFFHLSLNGRNQF